MVNTKDESNVCMSKILSKGSKEALIVLIITQITHVEGVERHSNYAVRTQNIHMSKGSKVKITFDPFNMLQHI